MTISGRVVEIKSGQSRNQGKSYWKIFVQSRADGREVTLFAWAWPIIQDVIKGQNYDFDVDYTDREMKYLGINRVQHVVYADDERGGYPASFDAPTNGPAGSQNAIEAPAPPPVAPQAPKTEPKGYGAPDSHEMHIIRESAAKSAAIFLARPSFTDKCDEDDLIYIASKIEDYIRNGAVL